MLKKSALPLALTYTLVITILSFISLEKAPKVDVNYFDKIVHFVMYFLFAIFWFYYFFSKNYSNAIFKAVGLAVMYGIVIEVLQGSLTPTREFDMFDILANIVGALFAIPFSKIVERYVKNM